MKNNIWVLGAGPGDPSYVTPIVTSILKNAHCVVVAKRHLSLAKNHKNIIYLENFDDTTKSIIKEIEIGDVAVLVSGDPGIYSLLQYLKSKFPSEQIKILPGISSLQTLAAAAKETWNDSVILSGHGKEIKNSKILDTIDKNRSTYFFCGKDKNPKWLCKLLAENEFNNIKVTIGENLSYPNEKITCGQPCELKDDYDTLSLVLIINDTPNKRHNNRPKDEEFIRAEVPMTREEVRSVIIDKMELETDSLVWDIGAGTGSISIASALLCTDGEVHAVEYNPTAVELEIKNIKKFGLFNVFTHTGTALDTIKTLKKPTHVFIGGSGKELQEILEYIPNLGENIKIVITGVTLKTNAIAYTILNTPNYKEFDAIQINISRAKKIAESTIMSAQNPITIFSAITNKTKEGL
ncbi:MAG: precorrin-6y C5,15-methyltransferase (decarboxylating) subunit CbiE [Synergistaceae bacterium]